MSSMPDPEKVLGRLVRDARAEKPAVSWNDVERDLFVRMEEESTPAPHPPMHSAAWLWVTPLAAALAAAGIFWMTRPTAPGTEAGAREAAARKSADLLDGASLDLPALVEATSRPVTVRHEGRATWTLAPHAQAHLERASEVIEIALDRGTLDARVEKSPMPESFVVRADHTRVAVHGTAFRVVRTDRDVTVEVTEGVVSVGPIGEPGVRLGPASHAVFALDGERLEPAGTTSAAPAAVAPGPVVAAVPEEREATARSGTEAPAVPGSAVAVRERTTRAASASAADRAVGAVRSCFASQTRPEGDLKITARTTLSLRVLPDGSVVQALFEPPLAPGVQGCVDRALSQIRFPETAAGLAVDRSISLER